MPETAADAVNETAALVATRTAAAAVVLAETVAAPALVTATAASAAATVAADFLTIPEMSAAAGSTPSSLHCFRPAHANSLEKLRSLATHRFLDLFAVIFAVTPSQ